MFSGKTEELLRRLRRAKIAQMKLAIFKPKIDQRYGQGKIVSHDANYFPSLEVAHSAQDEAQFFDEGIVDVVEKLSLAGVRVIVTGLDMDYLGKPFGPMPQLMAIANYVTKIHAICVRCGQPGTHSYRLAQGDARVMIGQVEAYEARCRNCFSEGMVSRAAN
jgi:thymidine kinase